MRREKLTSCGGISKETVLRSTFTKLSVQGRTKKSPERDKNIVKNLPSEQTFHPASV